MSTTQTLEDIDPADIGSLSAFLAAQETSDDKPAEETPQKGESPEPVESKADADDKPAAGNDATPGVKEQSDEPTGILLKDGKTVAPYAVLEGERLKRKNAQKDLLEERRQREAAETKAQELQQAIDALKAAKPGSQAQADAAALFTPEELAAMETDFPALKKLTEAFSKQADTINELMREKAAAQSKPEPKAEPTKDSKASSKETPVEPDDDDADQVAAQLHSAISALPLLSKWQSKGGALWAEAVAVDGTLREDPAWRGKSLAERFAEVERRVAADNEIPLPKATSSTPPQKKLPDPTPTPPQTLSDLPGKTPVSEEDAANAMSSSEMRAKFESMSNDQIAAFLARAG